MVDRDSETRTVSRTAITVAILGLVGTLGAAVIANWKAFVPDSPPRSDPASPLKVHPAEKGQPADEGISKSNSSAVGASYDLTCRDDQYRNTFTATIQFTDQTTARWKYTAGTGWFDGLRADYLSPQHVILSGGQGYG